MYPHERSLVKQLADMPFAIIGVNSDSDLDTIREVVKTKNISWRSFWNGPDGTGGAISTRWNVSGWPTMYVLTIPKRSPSNLFFFQRLLQFLTITITVDANQSKRFSCKSFHERPLVWVHGPARSSPVSPKIEHDHLSSVVAQFELHAIDVFAINLGRDFADAQVL